MVEKFLLFIKDGGMIINFLLVNVYMGMFNMVVYVVFKVVMNFYICMVVMELVVCGICVNLVNFGLVVIFIFGKMGMFEE